MVFVSPMNMNSVSMVCDELNSCMEHALQRADELVPGAAPEVSDLLHELRQIDGIIRVLECAGAVQLSAAVLTMAQLLADQPAQFSDAQAALLKRGLHGLQAYLTYSSKRRQAFPLALNGLLNELRAGSGMPLLSEAQQVAYPLPDRLAVDAGNADLTPVLADELPRIKRLQHMYQVGLLGALTGGNPSVNLRLMSCAVGRLHNECGKLAEGEWWALIGALLSCFAHGHLRLTTTRKRVLIAVDSDLRRRLRQGDGAPLSLHEDLRKELLCLLQLAGDGPAGLATVLGPYSLPSAGTDDRQLARVERELFSNSEQLLNEQGQELRDELYQVKELLNTRWESFDQQSLAQLTAHMQRVGDMLAGAGFNRLKGFLADRILLLGQARTRDDGSEEEACSGLAEAVLVVESTLADPDTFSDHALAAEEPGSSLLARCAREEAIGVVLNESKTAIHLAKRGITAYLESDFDTGHVANVGASLRMVQGAFKILDYQRAADVLGSCIGYVDSRQRDQELGQASAQQAVQSRQAVETLADALISIEYYIDDLAVSDSQNEELLVVAEGSIADLGYAA